MPSPYQQMDNLQPGQADNLPPPRGFVGPPDDEVARARARGASAAGKTKDWLTGALHYLVTGKADGKLPPAFVTEGAKDHLATYGGPTNEGGARMLPGAGSSPAGRSPAGGSELASKLDFSQTNYPGSGAQDSVRGPIARGGTTAGMRSAANGSGRGNGVTPSKPGKSTGKEPVTMAPRSSDPAASSTKDDVTQDPAVQGLSALLKKYTSGEREQVDLSPLAALSDSWSKGGKMLSGYERPMSDADRSKLTAGLTENLARRQSDIEWHKARMAQMGDKNDAYRYGADSRAEALMRTHGVDPNAGQGEANFLAPPKPAPVRGGGRGGPKPKTPEQESKAAYSSNSGILKNVVMSNFAGDPKALPGATQEAHQFADRVAKQYVAGGAYPDYNTAYQQAIHDLPEYARRGHFAPRGMRYHGANQIQQPVQDGGGGGE